MVFDVGEPGPAPREARLVANEASEADAVAPGMRACAPPNCNMLCTDSVRLDIESIIWVGRFMTTLQLQGRGVVSCALPYSPCREPASRRILP